MLTLKGKAFQVKPTRPIILKILKFLNKTKTGQLFDCTEVGKAVGSTRLSVMHLNDKEAPQLKGYSIVWRKQKLFGKPATIKLLAAEIKATKV
jgi:hypothetical protein